MPAIEVGQYGCWIGKQSAKGTPNTTPYARMQQVAGSLGVERDLGSEKYSDGTKYGNAQDFANSLLGNGDLGIQATPNELAYLLWLLHGTETATTVAAVTGPPAVPAGVRHEFTPQPGRGFWSGVWERVGASQVQRDRHDDCLLTKLVIEASSANKVMRVTPTFVSLDPGVKFTTDPAKGIPPERAFLHTDAATNAGASSDGKIAVNNQTFRTANQFRIEIDEAWSPYYGDGQTPAEMIQGEATVSVATTILADQDGLALWNQMVYGNANPPVNTKPLRGVPNNGRFETVHRQRDASGLYNGIQFDAVVPAVQWTLPPSVQPNPSGGATEIPIAGVLRQPTSGAAYTLGVVTPSTYVAFTV